jgi:error-prone DNA polymerase
MGTIHTFGDKMIGNMVARGYERDFAERCFKQIEGFGTYGFPGKPCRELRAARLCLGVDQAPSSGRVRLRAAEFAADGFYAPAEIVRDAREHDVECARRCELQRLGQHARAREDGALALRLGFRQMDGFRKNGRRR